MQDAAKESPTNPKTKKARTSELASLAEGFELREEFLVVGGRSRQRHAEKPAKHDKPKAKSQKPRKKQKKQKQQKRPKQNNPRTVVPHRQAKSALVDSDCESERSDSSGHSEKRALPQDNVSPKRTKVTGLQLSPSSVDELLKIVKLSLEFSTKGEQQLRYILASHYVQPLHNYRLAKDDERLFQAIIVRLAEPGSNLFIFNQMLQVFHPKLQHVDQD